MKLTISILMGLLAITGFSQDLNLYYGLLHAHTFYSDGSGTPKEAFEMARNQGLDFFAVTSHNHVDAEFGANKKNKTPRADGVLIANQPELYSSNTDLTVTRKYKKVWDGPEFQETLTGLKSVMRAAREATVEGEFVAIPGQEFSSISKGNHVNVLGIDELITVDKGDFKGLIQLIEEKKNDGLDMIIQLNHPGVYNDLFKPCYDCNKFNDYGIDDFGMHFKDLIEATNEHFDLIEVYTGPATTERTYTKYDYRYHHGRDYLFYLFQGFHLSPSVGQDNHYKTWGKTTPARMGVWATDLTQSALFDAMRNHRTFASEDSDLSLKFMINGNLMGSKFDMTQDMDLDIEVELRDGSGDLPVEMELYYGTIKAEEGNNATNYTLSDGKLLSVDIDDNGTHAIDGRQATGNPEFYFVVVTQADGDQAWSAPIWINYSASDIGGEVYYWTKNNSKYYHEENCYAALRINPENLKSGVSAPEGRQLHDCVISNSQDDH